MQQLDIVLVVLRRGDEFLLQKRDHNPSGAANLIGAYGGKVDKTDVDHLEAACREVSEETSLNPKREDLVYLGKVAVVCDYMGKPAKINGWSYAMQIDLGEEVESLEGTLVTMDRVQLVEHLTELTPGTRACFEQYILSEEADS